MRKLLILLAILIAIKSTAQLNQQQLKKSQLFLRLLQENNIKGCWNLFDSTYFSQGIAQIKFKNFDSVVRIYRKELLTYTNFNIDIPIFYKFVGIQNGGNSYKFFAPGKTSSADSIFIDFLFINHSLLIAGVRVNPLVLKDSVAQTEVLNSIGNNAMQQSNSAPQILQTLVSQKVMLKTEYLKTKPFYKKCFFFDLFKTHSSKRCSIDLTVQFGAVRKDNLVWLTLDDPNSTAKPVIKHISSDSFNQQELYAFLLNGVAQLTGRPQCDRCVEKFIDNYTTCVITRANCNSIIFIHHPDRNSSFDHDIQFVSNNSNQSPQLASPFPLGAVEGGTYYVTPGDATINNQSQTQTMYLPKNFKIKVSADVANLNWSFNKIIFEENATIDLSHRELIPVKPPTLPKKNAYKHCREPICNGPFWGHVCSDNCPNSHGKNGDDGIIGTEGEHGFDGTFLNINCLQIGNDNGSLWIKTDGGNGGEGGNGQDGDDGAIGDCGNGIWPKGTNGGNAGNGGPGNIGGRGGNIGIVNFIVNGVPVVPSPSNGCLESVRPGHVTGPTGFISIYGNPGCGGNGGMGGRAGLPGPRSACSNSANSFEGNVGVSHVLDQARSGSIGKGYPN